MAYNFNFDNLPYRPAPGSDHPSRNHISNTSQEHLQSQYNASNESVSQLAAAAGSPPMYEDIPPVDSSDQDWVFVRPAPPTSFTSNGTTDTDASLDQRAPTLFLTRDNLQIHDMMNDRTIVERLWDSGNPNNTNSPHYNYPTDPHEKPPKGKGKSFVAKKGTSATRLSDEDNLGGMPWVPLGDHAADTVAAAGPWADSERPPFIDKGDL